MTAQEAARALNLSVDLIPRGASNRPGAAFRPTHITIHNTANADPGADALMHARYVKGPDARARQVSWHFTVDGVRTVKHLPTNEKGFHAKQGNGASIGIEICEHAGIDQESAVRRAALLGAVLLRAHAIRLDRVVPHQHWTGKDCPRVVLREQGGFGAFRARVAAFVDELAADAGREAVAEGAQEEAGPEHAALAALEEEVAAAPDPGGAPAGGGPEHVAELERLLGRLLAENQALRNALTDAHEAD